MGASRKLQGEIDRVLKKVQEGVDVFDSIWNKVYDTENANQKEKFEADLKKEIKKLQRYRDQIKTWIQSSEIKDKKALMDARKLIEREMERFKVCEKETKTKAFSKEGLGQQPKTDPKEKAKSETRDWLNNVVGDLENQIENFEADIEGFSGKRGKTKNSQLAHLETSIGRHKAHIMKLELILRLLDNDELSADQVNDLKEYLEDYVECNQDEFERFDDVDEFYSSLPLDKVEALEDLITLCPSGLANASVSLTSQQNTDQDPIEETAVQDNNLDAAPKSPPSKTVDVGSTVSAASPSLGTVPPEGPKPVVGGPGVASILSSPLAVRSITENSAASVPSSLVNSPSNSVNEDDNNTLPNRRPSPALPEFGTGRSISRGIPTQASVSSSMGLSSVGGISFNGSLGSVPAVSDIAKKNMLSFDERTGSGASTPPLVSPLSNRMLLQQVSKSNDGSSNDNNNNNNLGKNPLIGGRDFSPSAGTGVQWRPQSPSAFQSQNETGQFRGRTEIAPDQREKFLQRLQQVQQQQGHSTLLSVPHLQGANQKQFPMQQQNSLLQQFNSQSSSLSPQLVLGLNIQSPGFSSITSAPLLTPVHHQSSPHPLISTGSNDADANHSKGDEQQQNLSDDLNVDSTANSSLNKIISDEDEQSLYTVAGSASMADNNQIPRDTDISSMQPLQASQSSSGSLGVIGRRSVSDLGAIGDNLSGSAGSSSIMHDQMYNMQMLDAAFYKLPQPKDSERAKSYVPRHPAVTPHSFPQTQADIVENPAFWERMGLDTLGTDSLFFAFYYQQNTFQQYLAARELKRQSWRYHRKYNTWFQRHEEPKVTNDEYEKGTYVYFDFHIADDGPQHGWCQRIKTEFTFEYNYLEDELVV